MDPFTSMTASDSRSATNEETAKAAPSELETQKENVFRCVNLNDLKGDAQCFCWAPQF